jgi:hypothetical protein
VVVRGVAVIIVNDELVKVIDVIVVVVGWVIDVSAFTSTTITIIAIVFVIDPYHCLIMRTTSNCPYCCYYHC